MNKDLKRNILDLGDPARFMDNAEGPSAQEISEDQLHGKNTFCLVCKWYEVIEQSALHTYHSALVFTPTQQHLYKRHCKEMAYKACWRTFTQLHSVAFSSGLLAAAMKKISLSGTGKHFAKSILSFSAASRCHFRTSVVSNRHSSGQFLTCPRI